MRKLASVQKIIDITPIPNADSIELAKVLGWQCVVKKGEYKVNDLIIYFEVDSFLPIRPEFEFLRNSSYKNSDLLAKVLDLKHRNLEVNFHKVLLCQYLHFLKFQMM